MYFIQFIVYQNLKYNLLSFDLLRCSLNNRILHFFDLLTKDWRLILFRFNLRIIDIFNNLSTQFDLLFNNSIHLTVLVLYTIFNIQGNLLIDLTELIIYICLYLSLLISNQTRQV